MKSALTPKLKSKLEETINKAMKRKDLGLKEEKDMCRYIPKGNSYLHTLAYRSLKMKSPEKLIELLEKHIIQEPNPQQIKKSSRVKWTKESLKEEKEPVQHKPTNENFEFELKKMQDIVKSLEENIRSNHSTTKFEKPPIIQLEERRRSPREETISNKHLYLVQNKLIKKILNKEVDEDLWEMFSEIVRSV